MTKGTFIAAAWGGFLATLTFWLYMDITHSRAAAWCGENHVDCVRNWISAFSGWAGAAGALVTVAVIYQQVTEMRRQFDVATGNVPPDLSVKPGEIDLMNGGLERFELTVTNWNIYPFEADGIEVAGGQGPIRPALFTRGPNQPRSDTFPRETVAGYGARTGQPPSYEVSVYLNHAPEGDVEFVVTGILFGPVHRRIELRARSRSREVGF